MNSAQLVELGIAVAAGSRDAEKVLGDAATQFLRMKGLTWSGRGKSEAARAAKSDAMNGAIRCPFSGQRRRK